MENVKMNQEKIDQIKSDLMEIQDSILQKAIIQDNKLTYSYKDVIYRCRMPNVQEEALAYEIKENEKLKLLQIKGQLTKKKLIQILKDNGEVDIEQLENKKNKIADLMKDKYLDLALISADYDKNIVQIEKLKQNIKDLKNQHIDISMEIFNYLSPSIDEKIQNLYMRYVTFLCTEKVLMKDKKENWVRVWDTYDDYEKTDNTFSNYAINYMSYLLINTRN